eukprot:PhF_6_TR7879/c0_g1_i1/m.11551
MQVIPRKHKSICNGLLVHKDKIWGAFSDGFVRVFTQNGTMVSELTRHDGPLMCVNEACGKVFTGSMDWTMCQWDPETVAYEKRYYGHANSVRAIVGSDATTKHVFSCSDDATIRVWNVGAPLVEPSEKSLVTILKGHTRSVLTMVYDAERKQLWTGGEDNSVRVWDTKTFQTIMQIDKHRAAVSVLLIDQSRVWSGSKDGKLYVWDCDNKSLLLTLNDESTSFVQTLKKVQTCVLWKLWACENDGTVKVWNLEFPQNEATFDLPNKVRELEQSAIDTYAMMDAKDRRIGELESKLNAATVSKDTLAQFQHKVSEAEDVLDRLRMAEELLGATRQHLREREDDLRAMTAERDATKKDLEQAQQEIKHLHDLMDQQRKDFEETVANLTARNANVVDELQGLSARNLELRDQLEQAERERDNLRQELDEVRALNDGLRGDLQRLEDDFQNLKREDDLTSNKLSEALRTIEDLQRERDELLIIQKEVLQPQANELERLKPIADQLHDENESLKDEVSRLRNEVAKLDEQNADHIQERDKLERTLEGLRDQLQELDEKLDNSVPKPEYQTLNEAKAAAEQKSAQVQDEMKIQEQELTALRAAIAELDKQVHEKDNICQKKTDEIAELTAKLQELQHSSKNAEDQEKVAREEAKTSSNRLKDLDEETSRLKDKLKDAENGQKDALTKLKAAEEKAAGIEDLQRRLKDAEQNSQAADKLIEAENKLKDTQSKLKVAEEKAKDLDRQVKELEQELSLMTDKNKDLEAKLKAAQNKLKDAEDKVKDLDARLKEQEQENDVISAKIKEQEGKVREAEQKLKVSELQGKRIAAEKDDEIASLQAMNQVNDDEVKAIREKLKALQLRNRELEMLAAKSPEPNPTSPVATPNTSRVAQLEAELRIAQNNLAEKSDDLAHCEGILAKEKANTADLRKQLDAINDKNRNLEGELSLASDVAKQAEKDVAVWRTECERQQEIAKNHAKRIRELESQSPAGVKAPEAAPKVGDVSPKSNADLQAKLFRLTGEFDDAKAALKHAEEQRAKDKKEIDKLRQDIAAANAAIPVLEDQVSHLQSENALIEPLKKDVDDKRTQVNDLKKQLADTQDALDKLKSESKPHSPSASKSVDDSKAKLYDLERQLLDCKSAGESKDKTIEEQKKKLEELQRQSSDASMEDMKKKLADLEKRLAESEKSKPAADPSVEELKKKVVELEKRLAENEKSKPVSDPSVEELKKKLAELEKRLADSEKSKSGADPSAEEMRKKIVELEKRLAESGKADPTTEELKKKIADLERELSAERPTVIIDEVSNKRGKKATNPPSPITHGDASSRSASGASVNSNNPDDLL